MPQYRNTISGMVVTTDEPDPTYEKHVRWRRVDEDAAAAAAPEPPAGNASTDEWQTYAISRGMPADEARGKTRKELRELYGG